MSQNQSNSVQNQNGFLTREQVEQALPANLKSAATPAFVAQINSAATDPLVAEHIRENFLGFSGVLKEGRFKTGDYLNAVTYTSYKLMGLSNHDAWAKTFPNRYSALVAKGTDPKDIAAHVSAYHRGKLVGLVLEQSLTPIWVLNQDIYQKAINVQAELMLHANSEKVRSDAANSIMTHLAKPKEAAQNNLQINVGENSGMTELKDLLGQMATKQQELIGSGVSTAEIAGQPLIEGKVKEANPDG